MFNFFGSGEINAERKYIYIQTSDNFFDKLHLFQHIDIWDLEVKNHDNDEQEFIKGYLNHHQKNG